MGIRFTILLGVVGLWGSSAFAVPGSGALGVFDPADASDPTAATGVWRAYSALDPSGWAGNELASTRIAYSSGNGASFSDVASVNVAQDLPQAGYSWTHEKPALVYDPSDPTPGSAWKLIWNHTLLNPAVSGNHQDPTGSWIGIRAAQTPNAAWGVETKLIAGSEFNPSNGFAPGAATFALPTGLTDCLAINGVTTLSMPDGFYLAFGCQTGASVSSSRISLTRIQHAGAATTITVKGTLLGGTDASLFGAAYGAASAELKTTVGFTGPSLVAANGKTYLIATPLNSSNNEMGCAVFEISNLESAALVRGYNGTPEAFQYAGRQTGTYRGDCTASAQGTSAGIVLSQLLAGTPPYTILATQLQLP